MASPCDKDSNARFWRQPEGQRVTLFDRSTNDNSNWQRLTDGNFNFEEWQQIQFERQSHNQEQFDQFQRTITGQGQQFFWQRLRTSIQDFIQGVFTDTIAKPPGRSDSAGIQPAQRTPVNSEFGQGGIPPGGFAFGPAPGTAPSPAPAPAPPPPTVVGSDFGISGPGIGPGSFGTPGGFP